MRARSAVVLVLCALLPFAPAEAQSKARQKELGRIQLRIQALNRSLEQDREKRDVVETEVEEAEKQLAVSRAELQRLSGELTTAEGDLAKARASRDTAAQQLKGEQKALAKELRASYVTGQQEQAKLLLSQDTAAPVGRLLTYQDYLARARADRVGRLKTEGERLTALETALTAQTTRLAGLKTENEKAVKQDLELKTQRARLLAKLNERIDDEESQLKTLERDERDVKKVLDNIQTVLADEPVKTPAAPERDGTPARAFTQGRGQMAWPLRGALLANYGTPKVGSKLLWKGLWIDAERGAPVKASARGRVAYVGFMHRYGLIVILEHENNHFTLYGHLDNVATAAGESVGVGEVIGQVGDSGGHDRTGLYFEVRKGTEPLDPRNWLQP